MIAEIHHKVFSNLEDELTGNFFGIMRYIPFQRGLKQIYMKYIHSLDESVHGLIRSIQTNDFDIEFWKRSELGYGEIDAYMELDGVGIGIEVKYQSGLSGENQLEREVSMLSEWCKSKKNTDSCSRGKRCQGNIPEELPKRMFCGCPSGVYHMAGYPVRA